MSEALDYNSFFFFRTAYGNYSTLDPDTYSVISHKFASHMSNTLDQIPVDKTTSPTESSRKMKPEVQ